MRLLAIMETDVPAIRIKPARGGFAATQPQGAGGWEGAGGGVGVAREQELCTMSSLREVFGIIWAARSSGPKLAWSTAKGKP